MTEANDLAPAEVIKRLGGNASAAEYFVVTPSAVSQWLQNGVPKDKLRILRLDRPEIFAKRYRASKGRGAPP